MSTPPSSAATTATRRVVPIDVRRLEEALVEAKTRFPNLEFDVRWRPFELNPRLPKGRGLDKMDYYNQKFGAARVQGMVPQMKAMAAEHGIQMEYGGHVGNTLDSHRLIWKAREVGGSELQDKVVEQLFRAYFEENQSLGEQSVLEECASNAGLDRAGDFLSDAELGASEVRQEMEEYGYQCRGVPMFIVDGKAVLNGAQESDAFLRVFGRL